MKGGITARAIEVVLVNVLHVPITVMFALPTAAVLLAVSVSVLVAVVGFGLNAAVTPLGRPDTARFTLPLNPFHGVTITGVLALDPCVALKLLAEADKVNVGCAPGQWFTRFAALMLPIPVAKSHPLVALYAG